ncbi:hypothetical protein [Nitratiruptor tergarcus]|uniref:hypothetical protein n=1 Tax=Nitratiruptor tergarcus TaxID=269259 RepID=UPI00117D05B8|nr:hypothetical protein [Nitratiruptor tergarcus]
MAFYNSFIGNGKSSDRKTQRDEKANQAFAGDTASIGKVEKALFPISFQNPNILETRAGE